MHDDPVFEAGLHRKVMIVVDLIIIPRGSGILHQLPGGGVLDQGRERITNLHIIVIELLFAHESSPRYSRMMPVLRPVATTSPCWLVKVRSVKTMTIFPVRPVRSATLAYLAVTVMVSPA